MSAGSPKKSVETPQQWQSPLVPQSVEAVPMPRLKHQLVATERNGDIRLFIERTADLLRLARQTQFSEVVAGEWGILVPNFVLRREPVCLSATEIVQFRRIVRTAAPVLADLVFGDETRYDSKSTHSTDSTTLTALKSDDGIGNKKGWWKNEGRLGCGPPLTLSPQLEVRPASSSQIRCRKILIMPTRPASPGLVTRVRRLLDAVGGVAVAHPTQMISPLPGTSQARDEDILLWSLTVILHIVLCDAAAAAATRIRKQADGVDGLGPTDCWSLEVVIVHEAQCTMYLLPVGVAIPTNADHARQTRDLLDWTLDSFHLDLPLQ